MHSVVGTSSLKRGRDSGFFLRPIVTEAPAKPAVDLAEVTDLLQGLLAEELDLTPPPFDAPPSREDPDEVRRQTAEALWQSLLFDSRG